MYLPDGGKIDSMALLQGCFAKRNYRPWFEKGLANRKASSITSKPSRSDAS